MTEAQATTALSHALCPPERTVYETAGSAVLLPGKLGKRISLSGCAESAVGRSSGFASRSVAGVPAMRVQKRKKP